MFMERTWSRCGPLNKDFIVIVLLIASFPNTFLIELFTPNNQERVQSAATQEENSDSRGLHVLRSYVEAFTLHGLSKVCTGYRSERIFWLFSLVIAFSFIGYICHHNYQTYLNKDVRTETRSVEQSEMTLPVFHVCPDFMNYNLHCYNNKSIYDRTIGYEKRKCFQFVEPKLHCLRYTNNKQSIKIPCGEKQLIQGCVSANADGSMKATVNTFINIYIDSDLVNVFLDNQDNVLDAKEVTLENMLDFHFHRESGEYYVTLHPRITERQPYPYPSNCSNGEGIDNFFTKIYSREACVQSCLLKRLFYKCGVVYDRWRKFVSPGMSIDPGITANISENDALLCMRDFELTDEMNVTASSCGCPLACNDTKISTQISYRERYISGYDLYIKFNPFEITHVREIPEYPIEQFVADIGGLAGLVAGMSVISILEIIICVVLLVLVKCKWF